MAEKGLRRGNSVLWKYNAGEQKVLLCLTSLQKRGQQFFPSVKPNERGLKIWGAAISYLTSHLSSHQLAYLHLPSNVGVTASEGNTEASKECGKGIS